MTTVQNVAVAQNCRQNVQKIAPNTEFSVRCTLPHMGYGSRKPVRILLLSVVNKTKCVTFALANEVWTMANRKKKYWFEEYRFKLGSHG
ncbi:hypothetical protein TNIN_265851 [Trichonephila inaurata madagascariensis]|uniref:Uncharacterized protein n=1 Tax=Trichonephila inaurata madagascariensis TaxID=2747483 RepID=A0A8X7BR42_9ARAC|nr:hypothetical protein TNIN_265851 [Trichonephila inaurata madagascariensis]